MIPKNIFQAWIGEVEPPPHISGYIEGVKRNHPDWSHVLLNNKDMEYLYKELPDNAKKVYDFHMERKEWGLVLDPIRFLVPYKFGGVFMDADVKFYPNRSLNELPLDKNLLFVNSFIHYVRPHTFFLASSQGNRFIKHLMDHMGKQSYAIPRRDVYNISYILTEYYCRFNPEAKERITTAFWKLNVDEMYVPDDEAIINSFILQHGVQVYDRAISRHKPMSSHTINKHNFIKQ